MSVDYSANFVKSQNVTHDAFLDGRLTMTQPKKGFRAGVDSVLLGASVSQNTRHVLDLGAGVGTAGLVAATYVKTCQTLLVEAQHEMVHFAEHNVQQNGLSERCRAAHCDISSKGDVRVAAGMKADFFDTVIANPPFFDQKSGTLAAETSRSDARHMPVQSLDDWVRVACSAAGPKGEIIFINRIEQLGELLSVFRSRIGKISILPISSRPTQEPGRFLIRGIKGSKTPMRLLMPLVMHQDEGNDFLPKVSNVLRGKEPLVW